MTDTRPLLRIALPNNGTAAEGTPARVTYDLIDEQFGVGYNGPLIISATIVGSDDPLQVMDGIADELRELPGVASVPLATPNENAEVGIVQVIPTGAPDSEETKDLVLRIRAMHDHFLQEYDVPVYVTGFTAVAIDVSDRLGQALLLQSGALHAGGELQPDHADRAALVAHRMAGIED